MFTIAAGYLVVSTFMSVRLVVQLAIERSQVQARQRADQAELNRMVSGLRCQH